MNRHSFKKENIVIPIDCITICKKVGNTIIKGKSTKHTFQAATVKDKGYLEKKGLDLAQKCYKTNIGTSLDRQNIALPQASSD